MRYGMELQTQILTDIGSGSIFEQIQKINEHMSQRLKFKVDLQEALFRDKSSLNAEEIEFGEEKKDKRLNRQDIEDIIEIKMEEVQTILDKDIKEAKCDGLKLKDQIEKNSQNMRD